MKNSSKVLLIVTIIVIVLATVVMSIIEANQRAVFVDGEVILPFVDGRFVVEGDGSSSMFIFGRRQRRQRSTTYHYVYIGAGAHLPSRWDEFLYIMNDISPVKVNALITDNSGRFREWRRVVFHVSEDTLIFSFYDIREEHNLQMNVHRTEHHGYLYFLIYEKHIETIDGHEHLMFDELSHHSLYRITLEELERLIDFTGKLAIFVDEFHGHTSPPITLFQIRAQWVWDNLVYFFDGLEW